MRSTRVRRRTSSVGDSLARSELTARSRPFRERRSISGWARRLSRSGGWNTRTTIDSGTWRCSQLIHCSTAYEETRDSQTW